MASPERPSRHGNAVADGPPRPFNSLAATNHLRSCAPRSRVEGWRGQGTKSVALRLVCVWRDRGGKPRAVPSPPRRRASPPPPVPPSLRCFVRLPAAPPQPHLPLTLPHPIRPHETRPDSCVDASERVVSRSRTRTMTRTGTRRGRAATTSTSRTVDYETRRVRAAVPPKSE